jgi:hypothetical protein
MMIIFFYPDRYGCFIRTVVSARVGVSSDETRWVNTRTLVEFKKYPPESLPPHLNHLTHTTVLWITYREDLCSYLHRLRVHVTSTHQTLSNLGVWHFSLVQNRHHDCNKSFFNRKIILLFIMRLNVWARLLANTALLRKNRTSWRTKDSTCTRTNRIGEMCQMFIFDPTRVPAHCCYW